MLIRTRFAPSVGLLSGVLAPIAILALPVSPLRLAVAMTLACFLPGWALVEGLFALYRRPSSPGERLLLGVGASYTLTVVGGLWLTYASGCLAMPALLIFYTAISLAGFGLALARSSARLTLSSSQQGVVRVGVIWTLILLLLAAYFCFYALAYSDFRGDEAEVVLRAVATVRGQGDPILSHTKGPAEILLVASVSLMYGAFGELSARLPFALASWLAVISTYVLGSRVLGRRVGLLAAALMVINGWLVSHSRTAQYQNLLVLMSILAVLVYYRFYETKSYLYHIFGVFFLVTALLCHYDGAATLPAILYLVILTIRGRPDRRHAWLWLGVPLLVGVLTLASFYVPFVLHPAIGDTQSYLSKFFDEALPFNNWDTFYVNALFYDSIYYVLGVGSVLLLGTLYGIRQATGGGRRGAVLASVALPLLLLSWTGLLPAWYALLVYLGLMALFLFSPRVGVPVKTMLLWMLLPFGLYLFIAIRPGNHFYVLMPPLMLLAALTLDRGWRWLEQIRGSVRRWVLPAALAGLLAWYGLSTWYEHLVFLRTDLEYMLTYPEHRNPVFWSDPRYPFDIRIGWGFPYRLGWQTVSELYRSGQLAGDWYGNDEGNSIGWYTLGWPRNPCYPRYFMLTQMGYHDPPLEVPRETIDRHYTLRATVQVNGQPRLHLYEFAPLGSEAQPAVYDEPAGYPTPYRQDMLREDPLVGTTPSLSVLLNPPVRFKPHADVLSQLAEAYGDPRITQVQDEAWLLGYDLDDTWAVPGGVILLTLYWETDRGLIFPYKAFTHLEDSRVWAQADDEPGCAQFPTNLWRPGDRVMDRHAIFLPEDMPPGEYPLVVGLYESRTGLRLDVLDQLGNPVGNALPLGSATVRPGN